MKYLIDTHVWLWLLEDPGKLAPRVRQALEAADDLVLSVASIWEAGIKVKLGKLSLPQGIAHARRRANIRNETSSRACSRCRPECSSPPLARPPPSSCSRKVARRTQVFFYDVGADGYSLDDKRDPISRTTCLYALACWRKKSAKKDTDRSAKHFMVPFNTSRECSAT